MICKCGSAWLNVSTLIVILTISRVHISVCIIRNVQGKQFSHHNLSSYNNVSPWHLITLEEYTSFLLILEYVATLLYHCMDDMQKIVNSLFFLFSYCFTRCYDRKMFSNESKKFELVSSYFEMCAIKTICEECVKRYILIFQEL